MLTGKQRAYLRGIANTVQCLYQIGKEGITDNVIAQFDDALEAREIIKIKVLPNSLLDTKDVIAELSETLNAEPVSAIGSKVVIYRQSSNKENRNIVIPK